MVCRDGRGARAERSISLGIGAGKGRECGASKMDGGGGLVSIASVGPSDAASKIAPGVRSARMQYIERWRGVGSWKPYMGKVAAQTGD